MRKRISIAFLCTVVIAIVALFATTEVKAFCDYCDPTDSFTDPDSGWSVTLTGITPIPGGCTGVDPDQPGVTHDVTLCYRWDYEITNANNTISGLNFFAMLIPDCCRGPYVYIDNEVSVTPVQSKPVNLKIFGVGEGEPSGFGEYNLTGYSIQGTPDNTTDWSLVTTTNLKVSLPAVIKVRKKGYLPFEIAGPGCSGFGAYTPGSVGEEMTIKGVRIRILRAPGTGCGIGLEKLIDDDWVPVDPEVTPPTTTEGYVVDCGGTKGKSGCLQECIVTAAESPGWTYINLGGTWYKVFIP